MPLPALQGAMMQCSFGLAPSTLNVIPGTVLIEGRPAATIMDTAMAVNIPPFALCTSLLNPITAAQTSAALGVLTPGTCTPTVVAPWTPLAPLTMIQGKPALAMGSMCMCAYGGVINIVNPGSATSQVS